MMERLREYSKGNNLYLFWRLFYLRNRTKYRLFPQLLTFVLNRFVFC